MTNGQIDCQGPWVTFIRKIPLGKTVDSIAMDAASIQFEVFPSNLAFMAKSYL